MKIVANKEMRGVVAFGSGQAAMGRLVSASSFQYQCTPDELWLYLKSLTSEELVGHSAEDC